LNRRARSERPGETWLNLRPTWNSVGRQAGRQVFDSQAGLEANAQSGLLEPSSEGGQRKSADRLPAGGNCFSPFPMVNLRTLQRGTLASLPEVLVGTSGPVLRPFPSNGQLFPGFSTESRTKRSAKIPPTCPARQTLGGTLENVAKLLPGLLIITPPKVCP